MAQYLDSPLRPFNSKLNPTTKKRSGTQGQIAPVATPSNPYIRPLPGGGSGAVASPSSNPNDKRGFAGPRTDPNAVQTTFNVNYESDPVLARIKALGRQNVGNAQTEAAALRKQAVIDTGLTDIGTEIGLDEQTLQAANQNPLSLKAQLGRDAKERSSQMDESLNQQNLFYSGHRANKLSELALGEMAAQADLARDLRGALGGIDAGILEAQNQAALQEQEAIEEAAAQAQSAAMQQAFLNALVYEPPAPTSAFAPMTQDLQVDEYGVPLSIVNSTGGQFLTPETAALADVNAYGYDPYEEDYALALALGLIPGANLQAF